LPDQPDEVKEPPAGAETDQGIKKLAPVPPVIVNTWSSAKVAEDEPLPPTPALTPIRALS
jgi:hypothetical protein